MSKQEGTFFLFYFFHAIPLPSVQSMFKSARPCLPAWQTGSTTRTATSLPHRTMFSRLDDHLSLQYGFPDLSHFSGDKESLSRHESMTDAPEMHTTKCAPRHGSYFHQNQPPATEKNRIFQSLSRKAHHTLDWKKCHLGGAQKQRKKMH